MRPEISKLRWACRMQATAATYRQLADGAKESLEAAEVGRRAFWQDLHDRAEEQARYMDGERDKAVAAAGGPEAVEAYRARVEARRQAERQRRGETFIRKGLKHV